MPAYDCTCIECTHPDSYAITIRRTPEAWTMTIDEPTHPLGIVGPITLAFTNRADWLTVSGWVANRYPEARVLTGAPHRYCDTTHEWVPWTVAP
jgi:hypothetical protein